VVQATEVYIHCSDTEVLYVGITGDGRRRGSQHARDATWWSQVTRTETHRVGSRDVALEAERMLIRILRPRYNVMHNGPHAVLPINPSVPSLVDDWRYPWSRERDRSGLDPAALQKALDDNPRLDYWGVISGRDDDVENERIRLRDRLLLLRADNLAWVAQVCRWSRDNLTAGRMDPNQSTGLTEEDRRWCLGNYIAPLIGEELNADISQGTIYLACIVAGFPYRQTDTRGHRQYSFGFTEESVDRLRHRHWARNGETGADWHPEGYPCQVTA
jgi:predicted GIY-YIG superfamily endonuclease